MDFELLEESLARIDNHLNQHDRKFAEITSTLPLEEGFSLVSDTIKELADKFHGLESRFYKGDYDKSLLKLLTLADDVQVLLHRTENQSNKLLNLEDRVDMLAQHEMAKISLRQDSLLAAVNQNTGDINRHEQALDSLLHDFEVNEQSLVRAHTNIAQLKVGIPASAHGLNDLAIQAETDLVKSNLCNEPRLASDVLSLCVSQLITKEEARRLMGFKS